MSKQQKSLYVETLLSDFNSISKYTTLEERAQKLKEYYGFSHGKRKQNSKKKKR